MITVKDLIQYRLEDRAVGNSPTSKHWAVTQVPKVHACLFETSAFVDEYCVLITGCENSTDWRAFWRLDTTICFVSEQASAAKAIAKEIAKNDPQYLTLWNVETGNSGDWVVAGAHLWRNGYVVDTIMKKPNWEIKQ